MALEGKIGEKIQAAAAEKAFQERMAKVPDSRARYNALTAEEGDLILEANAFEGDSGNATYGYERAEDKLRAFKKAKSTIDTAYATHGEELKTLGIEDKTSFLKSDTFKGEPEVVDYEEKREKLRGAVKELRPRRAGIVSKIPGLNFRGGKKKKTDIAGQEEKSPRDKAFEAAEDKRTALRGEVTAIRAEKEKERRFLIDACKERLLKEGSELDRVRRGLVLNFHHFSSVMDESHQLAYGAQRHSPNKKYQYKFGGTAEIFSKKYGDDFGQDIVEQALVEIWTDGKAVIEPILKSARELKEPTLEKEGNVIAGEIGGFVHFERWKAEADRIKKDQESVTASVAKISKERTELEQTIQHKEGAREEIARVLSAMEQISKEIPAEDLNRYCVADRQGIFSGGYGRNKQNLLALQESLAAKEKEEKDASAVLEQKRKDGRPLLFGKKEYDESLRTLQDTYNTAYNAVKDLKARVENERDFTNSLEMKPMRYHSLSVFKYNERLRYELLGGFHGGYGDGWSGTISKLVDAIEATYKQRQERELTSFDLDAQRKHLEESTAALKDLEP